ncbi:MAG: FtsX-like permease family protein [Nitrospirota bacterium]
MLNLHLVRRQIAGSRHQAVVFVLCVALSLVTLVSLSAFSRSVHTTFLKDARALHAADIIIHSHVPLSSPLINELSALSRQGRIETARVYEFYSVVRAIRGRSDAARQDESERPDTLLSNLKVVEPGYPFYGTLVLASGRPFGEVLTPGGIVVEQTLLERLSLKPGDRLKIGDAVFVIKDVVLQEPDRPVNFFSLGPRIFISSSDLASLDLVGKGSRVNYLVLARVGNQADLERIAKQLRSASNKDMERVDTFRTAESGVKRFFDNFLFFLNLIGIFTLLLAGIGIQSSLTAFLREQERTIAIMKAIGARGRFIVLHYSAVVFFLGLAGTVLGLAGGILLERVLLALFQGLLPTGIEPGISVASMLEGLVLGSVVVALFTLHPLLRLLEVRPRAIFGKTDQPGQGRLPWLFILANFFFFSGMVIWRLREIRMGAYFVLGLGLLITISFACADVLLRVLKRLPVGNLVFRQALKGLFRPGNATRAIIVTLTASLTVISSLTLVQRNLDETFVLSYPPDAPNLFFVDIQPSQKDSFAQSLGMDAIFYPVVRGTVVSVNSEQIDREQESKKRGDNLGREFNLTYRDHLLDDERIVAGKGLFRSDWTDTQVSVLDTVAKMRDMKIGDTIVLRIQGIPITARISSIRTRTHASIQPFFYFVFQEAALKDAPQTLFTAVRIEKGLVPALQNRMATRFPNVSIIDVTETISVFSRIMTRLSRIVNFFTLFSVAAGVLIIVSSVFATRYARVQEAVFFTILGARPRFVLAVFAAENLLIGLASGLLAVVLSQTTTFIICKYALDVPYSSFIGKNLAIVSLTVIVVIAAGLGASVPALHQKPAAFLREQTEE